ncbi:13249_t:CDS:2 [Funneliformis geosporum]|uniref:13249_t:CDS:1 n=1 Tax=Funneliformis geosporum TaxID=1117311 RepID=A0A9W4SZ99_9GLOM|nr:13249_t:CDS:2 [Funneliformis geosporum]
MVFPKILKPRYLADIFITLFLKIVLAILLKILYYIKGEEVRVTKVEVPNKKTSEETLEKNTSNERSINPNELINERKKFFVEQKDDEIIDDDEKSEESSSDSSNESSEEEFETHHEISCPPFEIRTSHSTNRIDNLDILPFEFKWKHGGNDVIITGDFDMWQCTHKMKYNPLSNDFVAVIDIDRTKQHEFKFIVDGMWQANWDLPTQTDEHGNVNNVIYGFPDSPLNTFKEYSAPFSQFAAAAY